ncbi:MAG: hypothetical protein KF862_10210 [Chitinophagaceae bacterium]|nr:hypothetical protein [Chitinophagaceae bacterium]
MRQFERTIIFNHTPKTSLRLNSIPLRPARQKSSAARQEHHKKETFKDEYLKMLSGFGVAYNEKYVFHDLPDE